MYVGQLNKYFIKFSFKKDDEVEYSLVVKNQKQINDLAYYYSQKYL